MIEELESNIKDIFGVFDYILNDEKITCILKYALACGNYMNGTGKRGGAYGFNLESVEKLNQLKGNVRNKTLLNYIIDRLEKKFKNNFINVDEDLEDFQLAQRMPIS